MKKKKIKIKIMKKTAKNYLKNVILKGIKNYKN